MQPTSLQAAMREDRSIDLKCRQYQQGVSEAMAASWQAAGSHGAPGVGSIGGITQSSTV
jgi:hypothetical protein